MAGLLTVDEALARILTDIAPLAADSVPLDDSLGRVLAEDIRSNLNLPPFANSSMDGFAVRADDVRAAGAEAPVTLNVVMDIPAGSTPSGTLQPGEAARIMTGAPLPAGADAVVPVEDTDAQFNARDTGALPPSVRIRSAARTGDNVRPIGEDIADGQTVLTAGTLIRPAEIGVLAALGRATVPVIRAPRVAIVSTGDELVGIGEPLAPGKIHDSNAYTLAALIRTHGGEAIRVPVARDTLEDARRRFREALDLKPDLVLSSAGVSVGAFDVVRSVLDELGQINFWRVNLRPGKPLAFGRLGGVPFFGLPGNPVSAMVTFDVFVRPVLLKMARRPDAWPTVEAVTGEAIQSDGRQTYARVTLTRDNGRLIAHTTGTQSSGALSSMVKADGLLIIPAGLTNVPAGTPLQVRLLKALE